MQKTLLDLVPTFLEIEFERTICPDIIVFLNITDILNITQVKTSAIYERWTGFGTAHQNFKTYDKLTMEDTLCMILPVIV